MNFPTDIPILPPGNLDHTINPHVLDTPQGRLIQQVCYALQYANLRQSKADARIFGVEGMSTHNVRHFLNNLCSMPGVRYLEVGSYKGSTLCAALSNNNVDLAVAYENYTEFDQSTVKNDLKANIAQFKGQQIVKLMECDFFTNLPKDGEFNVYFYDGAHTRDTQYRALAAARPMLAKFFVLLVDDFNCQVSMAREMTFKAIQDFRFKQHLFVDLAPGSLNYHTGQGLFVLERL